MGGGWRGEDATCRVATHGPPRRSTDIARVNLRTEAPHDARIISLIRPRPAAYALTPGAIGLIVKDQRPHQACGSHHAVEPAALETSVPTAELATRQAGQCGFLAP